MIWRYHYFWKHPYGPTIYPLFAVPTWIWLPFPFTWYTEAGPHRPTKVCGTYTLWPWWRLGFYPRNPWFFVMTTLPKNDNTGMRLKQSDYRVSDLCAKPWGITYKYDQIWLSSAKIIQNHLALGFFLWSLRPLKTRRHGLWYCWWSYNGRGCSHSGRHRSRCWGAWPACDQMILNQFFKVENSIFHWSWTKTFIWSKNVAKHLF